MSTMKLSELLATNPRLDLDLEIDPEDYVADILVLGRAVQLETNTDCLLLGASDGTTGIVQYGLVRAATLQVEDMMTDPPEDP